MKTKELKPGDIIEVREDLKELFGEWFKDLNYLQAGIEALITSHIGKSREIWKRIEILYPETKDWKITHNAKTGNLTLIRKDKN